MAQDFEKHPSSPISTPAWTTLRYHGGQGTRCCVSVRDSESKDRTSVHSRPLVLDRRSARDQKGAWQATSLIDLRAEPMLYYSYKHIVGGIETYPSISQEELCH